MAETIQITDLFDLRSFASMPDSDNYEKIRAAEQHLFENCCPITSLILRGAINPVKMRCRRLEAPSVNSHGEFELWVRGAEERVSYEVSSPIRSQGLVPKEAILCIDTKKRINQVELYKNPYFFLQDFWVYGNVREAREGKRHVPGGRNHFIELGALSYSDIGNSWTSGVYGKCFNLTARAEE